MGLALELHILGSTGPLTHRRFAIEGRRVITLGTADDVVDVFLDDVDAEPFHAVIDVSRDAIMIADLGSSQGTEVNGERITSSRLCGGDLITIGTTELVVAVREENQAIARVAAPITHTDIVRPTRLPQSEESRFQGRLDRGNLARRIERQRRKDRRAVFGGATLFLAWLTALPVFATDGVGWVGLVLGLSQRAEPAGIQSLYAHSAVTTAGLLPGQAAPARGDEPSPPAASTEVRPTSAAASPTSAAASPTSAAASPTSTAASPTSAADATHALQETTSPPPPSSPRVAASNHAETAGEARSRARAPRRRAKASARVSRRGATRAEPEAVRPDEAPHDGSGRRRHSQNERHRMAEVAHAVDAQVHRLRRCLATGVSLGELAPGNHLLVLNWLVGLGGRPLEPRLVGPRYLRGTRTAACVENRVLDWRFSRELVGTFITNFPLPTRVSDE